MVFLCTDTTTTPTVPPQPICSELNATKYLHDYNLITLEDLTTTSDVDYRTLVCGSLLPDSAGTFGISANELPINSSTPVLEIARSIPKGKDINVQVGSVAIGQSNDLIIRQGKIPTLVNNRKFNINAGNQGAKLFYDSKLNETCQKIKEQLRNLSIIFSHKPPNNNLTIPNDQPAPLIFNVLTKDSDGLAIFDVPNGNSIFHNDKVQNIEIENNQTNASLIVINVGGKTITYDKGNISGSLTQSDTRSRVLFNFYEAEQINLNKDFMGALLAPLAKVQTTANIDGSTVVKSLNTSSNVQKPDLVYLSCTNKSTTTTTTTISPTSKTIN